MTALLRLLRSVPWQVWLMAALLLGLCLMLAASHAAGERDAEARRADRDQAVVTRAADGRETAAGDRAADTRRIQTDLNERNRDAEATPDSPPDDRELRRRCRQLRDAGTTGLPACRGFEAGA